MASIRGRSNKWQARIIRKGHSTIAKTFLTRQDAEKWARSLEIEIDRGTYINKSYAEKTQFKEILQKYLDDVAPHMRSADNQSIRVKKLMRHPIATVNMAHLSPKHIADYRDERLKVNKPNKETAQKFLMELLAKDSQQAKLRDSEDKLSNPFIAFQKEKKAGYCNDVIKINNASLNLDEKNRLKKLTAKCSD